MDLFDLLDRPPLAADAPAPRAVVGGRRVLITGAGGSIGARLTRTLLAEGETAGLLLVDHAEHDLAALRDDVEQLGPSATVRLALVDVRDAAAMRALLLRHRPELVVHTAAFKHVPLLESQVPAAVANNALATVDLLDACATTGVRRCVVVSTDKAVEPVSVLGATKRMAELAVLAAPLRPTSCGAVRLANVWGSRGSVVPRFARSIAAGRPLALTDPEATRMFVAPEEAVRVLLATLALGRPGEILAVDPGPPLRLGDLAHAMLAEAGHPAVAGQTIVLGGLRPGERLRERMLATDERGEPVGVGGLLRVDGPGPDGAAVRRSIDELRRAVAMDDAAGALDALRRALPGFAPGTASREAVAEQGSAEEPA